MPQFLELNENVCIWADFGTGDHRRLPSINDSYDELGDFICLGLLFFHCFTGCDSTCSFFRKTKRFWFDLWMKQQVQDNVTSVFQHLSWLPSEDILGPGTVLMKSKSL